MSFNKEIPLQTLPKHILNLQDSLFECDGCKIGMGHERAESMWKHPCSVRPQRLVDHFLADTNIGAKPKGITDDVSDVCGGYGMGSGSVGLGPLVYAGTQPLVRLAWFTFRLVGYVGWYWPAALAAYSIGSLAITRLLWNLIALSP